MGKRSGGLLKPRQERERYKDQGPRQAKVKKLKKGQVQKNRSGQKIDDRKLSKDRESDVRKQKQNKHARLVHCNKQVKLLKQVLERYKKVADPVAAEKRRMEFEKMKKERVFGAARPWDSREKSKHGCHFDVYECMDRCGDWEFAAKPENVLEVAKGAVYTHCKKGAEYCTALKELAECQLSHGDSAAAVRTLSELMEADAGDHLKARYELLVALLDAGELGHARALLDGPHFAAVVDTTTLYSKALIEYIAWALLEEEDASEETAMAALKAAGDHNPHASILLTAHDAFIRVVDPASIDPPGQESEEGAVEGQAMEAIRYCAKTVMIWRDADGATEWINESLPYEDLQFVVDATQKVELYGQIMQKAHDLQDSDGGEEGADEMDAGEAEEGEGEQEEEAEEDDDDDTDDDV